MVEDIRQAVTVKYDGGEFSVKGSEVPCVLPNIKSLTLNLNFITGKLPNWLVFHPYLIDWYPESMVFQQETGKNSAAKDAGFDEVPMDFEYFYGKVAKRPECSIPEILRKICT